MVSAHPIRYLQLVLMGAYLLARRFTSSFPKHGNVKDKARQMTSVGWAGKGKVIFFHLFFLQKEAGCGKWLSFSTNKPKIKPISPSFVPLLDCSIVSLS